MGGRDGNPNLVRGSSVRPPPPDRGANLSEDCLALSVERALCRVAWLRGDLSCEERGNPRTLVSGSGTGTARWRRGGVLECLLTLKESRSALPVPHGSSSFDVAGGRGRRAIGRAASTPCPTGHPRQPDASVGARTRAKSVSSGHSGDPGWVTWCEWTGAVGASKWEGGGRGTPGTFEGGRLDEERANGDVLGGGRGRKRRASISASKRVRVHVGWIRKTGQKGRSGCEKGGRARVCWNEVDEKGTKKAAVKMHYNALLESPKDASPTILHA